MRALLTGASGFVGGWLSRHLEAQGDEVLVLPDHLDIREGEAVAAEVLAGRPDAIYHLAALSHVGQSWETPGETVAVNVLGTLAVLEAARALDPPPRVLVVSSAEVYGNSSGPFDEQTTLRPISPYAASKVAAEYLALQANLGRGLPAVLVRPFNHVGPGQSPTFVVSALARRVALAEREGGGVVAVGNLEPRRDITDVRDVVRAYRLLVELGEAGQVYNVCSGRSVPIGEVVERLVGLAKCELEVVEDPSLVRPVDVPVLAGDASKLRRLTGWAPEISLEATLAEVLEHWRQELLRAEGR